MDEQSITQQPKRSYTRRSAVHLTTLTVAGLMLGALNPAQADAATRYSIVYKLHGGKNPATQKLKITRRKKYSVAKLKKPKRKGYKFMGWYKDKKRKKRATYVYGRLRKSHRTVHAKWSKVRYSISYRPGMGATLSAKAKEHYYVTTKTFKLKSPKKSGFVFKGWYKDKSFSKPIKKVYKGSAGNLKLYANWQPQDWDTHMKAKLAKIKSDVSAMGSSGDTFVFLTDLHWEHNAQQSPARIKEVLKSTPVKKVVIGGDILTFRKTKQKAAAVLKDFMGKMSFADDLHYVRGNHDRNMEDPRYKSGLALSDAELRSYITIPAYSTTTPPEPAADGSSVVMPSGIAEPGKFYYYADNAASKIRYLFCDTGNLDKKSTAIAKGDEQYVWLEQRIRELSAGWNVVVFQHMFFRESGYDEKSNTYRIGVKSAQQNGYVVKKLLDTLADDPDVEARILAVFCGHCHLDYAQRSEKGYWMIMTATDAFNIAKKYSSFDTFRVKGTSSGQAIDVVVINTKARTIRLTRIGYGSDRSFTY